MRYTLDNPHFPQLPLNELDSTDDCDLFIDAEKWAHRFDADNDEFDYGHNVKHNTINEED